MVVLIFREKENKGAAAAGQKAPQPHKMLTPKPAAVSKLQNRRSSSKFYSLRDSNSYEF